MERFGVEVRLDRQADIDEIRSEKRDAVVVATGSSAYRPEILGTEQKHVLTSREVIRGNAEIGQQVLVVDTLGRAEGATTAEMLADQGREVDIVTGLEYVARDIPPAAWHPLMEQLMLKGVPLTPFTGIWEILENSVEAYNVFTWQPRTMEGVDTVVLASGGAADESLFHSLTGEVTQLQQIGDYYQPRGIELAVIDGHRIGSEI